MRLNVSRSLLLLTLLALPVRAQVPDARPFRLREYLAEVEKTNLDLAAARYNLPIAEAQVTLAKLFPDPQLTGGIDSYDLTDQRLPTSLTWGLSQTVELGGKRGARIGEARAGVTLAQAQLSDFFETLRVNATNAFIDALSARQVLERKRRTLESVEKLVAATEQRLRAGDVSPTALWQVKVEAERFRADLVSAEGDVRAADATLELYLGAPAAGQPGHVLPVGDLRIPVKELDPEVLVNQAVEARSDVLVALGAENTAQAHVGVARANRWVDLGVGAVLTHSPSDVSMGIPAQRTLGLTLSVPLPFSRLTHGELDAARAAARQAETQSASAKRRVAVEVRRAFARYEATRRAVDVYAGEVLRNADKALEATRYSYERGATRLLELLDAQRTVDDVYLGYASALAEHARALVTLERAAATWDLEL